MINQPDNTSERLKIAIDALKRIYERTRSTLDTDYEEQVNDVFNIADEALGEINYVHNK